MKILGTLFAPWNLPSVRVNECFLPPGLNWQTTGDVNCDNDGSFGMVSCDPTTNCRCVDKMYQSLRDYSTPWANRTQIDCRSATGTKFVAAHTIEPTKVDPVEPIFKSSWETGFYLFSCTKKLATA